MSQREDSHPYMSKAQLDDYLASIRQDFRNGGGRRSVSDSSTSSSEGGVPRGSTPLVRALKERHGSGNTIPGYVDVGVDKGRTSPTTRVLPLVPRKPESSAGWRFGRKASKEAQSPPKQENIPYPEQRKASPPAQGDFWSTGVVRPLPYAPKSGRSGGKPDPRDDLRMPNVADLSISESQRPAPVNVPSISAPSSNLPILNVPVINVPDDSVPEQTYDKPVMSWPNTQIRSKKAPALVCDACSRPIAGRIVTAVGRRFHPNCFRCDKCNIELEHVAFYEHDGKVYCHLDYHELFSPRCKHCDTPIENEVISALGNKYHPGHFFCAGCGDPFGATTPFIVRDKYPWCEKCYENKYSPKCGKCRKPILDEVLNAMGKTWHPAGCFVCKECGRDFGDDGFFIDSADGQPICKPCKHVRLIRQVEKIKA